MTSKKTRTWQMVFTVFATLLLVSNAICQPVV